MRILLFSLFLFLACQTFAQKKNRQKKNEETSASEPPTPTSLAPVSTPQFYIQKKSKRSMVSNDPVVETQQEYVTRMIKLVKEKKKVARMMEKPQYSDPMYFGHKRPPKKHKPSRMTFCKECGIRH